MSTYFRRLFVLGALATGIAATNGCVADRPARNGVFNENQYLRKDFIIRPGDATNPDNGWVLKATITDASAPNPFGDSSIFGLFAGSHSNGDLIHFVVTSDKLQMVSNREISSDPTVGQVGEVMNAWPITNVDLKYQVNLDGEKTNFYSENQELDWQVRQWVKVNFDKNDMSDLAPLGTFFNLNIANCTDTPNISVTLVPNSFIVDEVHDYMEWSVQVTLPIAPSTDNAATCNEGFGANGVDAARLGRTNETVNLKYSMARQVGSFGATTPSYVPLIVAEKDPIQKKYGAIAVDSIARDPNTGLLASNQYVVRYDPTKPIVWYFEAGFPAQYMPYFTNNTAVLPTGTSPFPTCTAPNTPSNCVQTIEDATNQLLKDSGAAAQVSFQQYNVPLADGTAINRTFGDVRWNMLRWLESEDQQEFFAGVTSEIIDPRSGENLSTDIVFENFAIKDYYVTRIDAYLQSIGASAGTPFDQTPWPTPPLDANGNPLACSSAADLNNTVPIIPLTAVLNHNGNSTLFQKIQSYLYKPATEYGPLGPADFAVNHVTPQGTPDTDFYNAYYAYLPYIVFADPATNPFVTPESGSSNTGSSQSAALWQMLGQEAQLHQLESQLDTGYEPFDVGGTTGEQDAVTFMQNYKALTLNHHALNYAKAEMPFMPGVGHPLTHADTPDSFAMISAIQKDARHCIEDSTGFHWETKDEWVTDLINTYWSQVFWHEFGHAMGLEHNFMASVDMPNFPASPVANAKNADGSTRYPLYASSVMEYNAAVDRIFWNAGWAPYDQGAISWIYANNNGKNVPVAPSGMPTPKGVSGQISASYPWFDPHGFDSMGNEIQYLYCNEKHTKYTPLCRAGDLGTTPSEITANEIDSYEWQYQWRNFRQYRKIWDDSNYGDTPMNFVTELRRFLSLWAYDMSSSELTQRFEQIGVTPPSSAPSAQFYYDQLTAKFGNEMAAAGELGAAFHEAIVQQSAGARPYITVFDNYFGDVTQQGIFLDKLDAIQSFSALWPVDNYDQTQSAGQYIASYAAFGTSFYVDQTAIGSSYQTAAEQAIQSMLGGSFDAFYYAKPLAVAQFTFDTHNPDYLGSNASPARPEAAEWAGGYQFGRLQDFLAFFQNIAVENNFQVNVPGGVNIDCTGTVAACNYDPTTPRAYPTDTFYSDSYNRFLGPDGRRWIWVYLQDRNEWLACDQDRNVATYVTMYNYTTDVIFEKDDGNTGPAFADALQLKYMFDYYAEAEQLSP